MKILRHAKFWSSKFTFWSVHEQLFFTRKPIVNYKYPWFCIGFPVKNIQSRTRQKINWELQNFACLNVLMQGFQKWNAHKNLRGCPKNLAPYLIVIKGLFLKFQLCDFVSSFGAGEIGPCDLRMGGKGAQLNRTLWKQIQRSFILFKQQYIWL